MSDSKLIGNKSYIRNNPSSKSKYSRVNHVHQQHPNSNSISNGGWFDSECLSINTNSVRKSDNSDHHNGNNHKNNSNNDDRSFLFSLFGETVPGHAKPPLQHHHHHKQQQHLLSSRSVVENGSKGSKKFRRRKVYRNCRSSSNSSSNINTRSNNSNIKGRDYSFHWPGIEDLIPHKAGESLASGDCDRQQHNIHHQGPRTTTTTINTPNNILKKNNPREQKRVLEQQQDSRNNLNITNNRQVIPQQDLQQDNDCVKFLKFDKYQDEQILNEQPCTEDNLSTCSNLDTKNKFEYREPNKEVLREQRSQRVWEEPLPKLNSLGSPRSRKLLSRDNSCTNNKSTLLSPRDQHHHHHQRPIEPLDSSLKSNQEQLSNINSETTPTTNINRRNLTAVKSTVFTSLLPSIPNEPQQSGRATTYRKISQDDHSVTHDCDLDADENDDDGDGDEEDLINPLNNAPFFDTKQFGDCDSNNGNLCELFEIKKFNDSPSFFEKLIKPNCSRSRSRGTTTFTVNPIFIDNDNHNVNPEHCHEISSSIKQQNQNDHVLNINLKNKTRSNTLSEESSDHNNTNNDHSNKSKSLKIFPEWIENPGDGISIFDISCPELQLGSRMVDKPKPKPKKEDASYEEDQVFKDSKITTLESSKNEEEEKGYQDHLKNHNIALNKNNNNNGNNFEVKDPETKHDKDDKQLIINKLNTLYVDPLLLLSKPSDQMINAGCDLQNENYNAFQFELDILKQETFKYSNSIISSKDKADCLKDQSHCATAVCENNNVISTTILKEVSLNKNNFDTEDVIFDLDEDNESLDGLDLLVTRRVRDAPSSTTITIPRPFSAAYEHLIDIEADEPEVLTDLFIPPNSSVITGTSLVVETPRQCTDDAVSNELLKGEGAAELKLNHPEELTKSLKTETNTTAHYDCITRGNNQLNFNFISDQLLRSADSTNDNKFNSKTTKSILPIIENQGDTENLPIIVNQNQDQEVKGVNKENQKGTSRVQTPAQANNFPGVDGDGQAAPPGLPMLWEAEVAGNESSNSNDTYILEDGKQVSSEKVPTIKPPSFDNVNVHDLTLPPSSSLRQLHPPPEKMDDSKRTSEVDLLPLEPCRKRVKRKLQQSKAKTESKPRQGSHSQFTNSSKSKLLSKSSSKTVTTNKKSANSTMGRGNINQSRTKTSSSQIASNLRSNNSSNNNNKNNSKNASSHRVNAGKPSKIPISTKRRLENHNNVNNNNSNGKRTEVGQRKVVENNKNKNTTRKEKGNIPVAKAKAKVISEKQPRLQTSNIPNINPLKSPTSKPAIKTNTTCSKTNAATVTTTTSSVKPLLSNRSIINPPTDTDHFNLDSNLNLIEKIEDPPPAPATISKVPLQKTVATSFSSESSDISTNIIMNNGTKEEVQESLPKFDAVPTKLDLDPLFAVRIPSFEVVTLSSHQSCCGYVGASIARSKSYNDCVDSFENYCVPDLLPSPTFNANQETLKIMAESFLTEYRTPGSLSFADRLPQFAAFYDLLGREEILNYQGNQSYSGDGSQSAVSQTVSVASKLSRRSQKRLLHSTGKLKVGKDGRPVPVNFPKGIKRRFSLRKCLSRRFPSVFLCYCCCYSRKRKLKNPHRNKLCSSQQKQQEGNFY